MKKILIYADSPECFSGFAQVVRNIIKELAKTGEFEITVFGINQPSLLDEFGQLRSHEYNCTLIDATYTPKGKKESHDVFGKQNLINYMFSHYFDVFFTIQDLTVITFLPQLFSELRKVGKQFKTVVYFPVDADQTPKEWLDVACHFDVPVVYTEYGMKILQKHFSLKELEHFHPPILHGVNTESFYKYSKNERKNARKEFFTEDTFVVLNVNRNQPRKDLCRSLHAFSLFKEKVPKTVYVLHCDPIDVGNNLIQQAKYYNLEVNKDVFFPTGKSNWGHTGYPIDWVNRQYNMADVVISTSLGEGFGLSSVEAFAVGVPVILPRNTANIEIIGEKNERGLLVDSGSTENLWRVLPHIADDPPRPVTDIDDLVLNLEVVYQDWLRRDKGETETKIRVRNAYTWAKEHTWSKIVSQKWYPLFKNL